MAYKGVIFDLDGTLLNTLQDLTDSVNAALTRAGLPLHSADEYKYFVGDGVEELARRVLPEVMRNGEAIAGLVADIRQEYSRRWADTTRPYEGIPELLDALRTRGIKMSVLSNKPEDSTRATVSRLLDRWQSDFDMVIGVSPSVPRKPDPTAALNMAKQMGIPPQQMIYVGDTDTDMKTAVAAGMYPVGALWGYRTAEELKANGARILLRRPAELLTILNS
jgi:phosphoglycolate phosphatase